MIKHYNLIVFSNCDNPTQLNPKLGRPYFPMQNQNHKPQNQNRIPLFLSSYLTKLNQIQYAILLQPNQKIHAKKKILPKFFLPKKNFRPKKLSDPNFFYPKKIPTQFFVSKFSLTPKKFRPKFCLPKKTFNPNFFDPKNILTKLFLPKIISLTKFNKTKINPM